jgi:hypothetical protein
VIYARARMPVSFANVAAIIEKLPGVGITTKWRNKNYVVGDKGFAWERPLSKADIARFGDETPPQGEILAVRTDGLDGKEAVLAMDLPGFFTIPHFHGYAAVLIELRKARAKDVRTAIAEAYRVMSAAKPKRKRKS